MLTRKWFHRGTITMSIVRIAIRVDRPPVVVYLFRTRVRSWQKALAGAARRIRCHSHPRMLLHSEPRALYVALIFSLGLSLSPLLTSPFARPILVYASHFSFLVGRTFLVLLKRVFFPFSTLSLALVHCLRRSRALPTTVSVRRHVLRCARLFHKPINARNKLEIGSVLRWNVNAREDDRVIPWGCRLDGRFFWWVVCLILIEFSM